MSVKFIYMAPWIKEQFLASLDYKIFRKLNSDPFFKVIAFVNINQYNDDDCFENIPIEKIYLPKISMSMMSKIINFNYFYIRRFKIIRKERENLFIIPVKSDYHILGLIPLFLFRRRIAIQLYTPSVVNNKYKRILLDSLTKYVLKLFKNYLTADSSRLKKIYDLKKRNCKIIKIGMCEYGNLDSLIIDKPRLIYIGTLDSRKIDIVVNGVAVFLKKYGIPLEFNIIGSGKLNVVNVINNTIEERNLTTIIKYHGFKSNQEVSKFISISNIGVSFVPMLKKYEGVPITKTIEYMLSGLPVIGTSNSFNRNIITEENGILCEDNAESFAKSLYVMWLKISQYNCNIIKASVDEYSMELCLENNYVPVLKDINRSIKGL